VPFSEHCPGGGYQQILEILLKDATHSLQIFDKLQNQRRRILLAQFRSQSFLRALKTFFSSN